MLSLLDIIVKTEHKSSSFISSDSFIKPNIFRNIPLSLFFIVFVIMQSINISWDKHGVQHHDSVQIKNRTIITSLSDDSMMILMKSWQRKHLSLPPKGVLHAEKNKYISLLSNLTSFMISGVTRFKLVFSSNKALMILWPTCFFHLAAAGRFVFAELSWRYGRDGEERRGVIMWQ